MDQIRGIGKNTLTTYANEKSKDQGFSGILKKAVEEANRTDLNADAAIRNMLERKADITETMLAIQNADISMRLAIAVRNKVIDAYREIMRMQF